MSRAVAEVRFYDAHPGIEDLRRAVLHGLAASPKALPPKFFYDRRGSELFDAICELPEYYQTRTETEILRRCVPELAAMIGNECLLVELGSGASKKVRLLLGELRPSGYLGLDISKEFLLAATRRLARDYPWLEVHAACVDFSHRLEVPDLERFSQRLAFYPGSSIGNFDPPQAQALLGHIGGLVGPGGNLLIGVDLRKSAHRLNAAYNDAAGITRAFNLNLLERIRRELDSDIPLQDFEHYAFYNPGPGRIEMHLVSRRSLRLRIEDRWFHMHAGESIHTENSYKYTAEGFAALAAEVGWSQTRVWTDPECLFSVQLLAYQGPQKG